MPINAKVVRKNLTDGSHVYDVRLHVYDVRLRDEHGSQFEFAAYGRDDAIAFVTGFAKLVDQHLCELDVNTGEIEVNEGVV